MLWARTYSCHWSPQFRKLLFLWMLCSPNNISVHYLLSVCSGLGRVPELRVLVQSSQEPRAGGMTTVVWDMKLGLREVPRTAWAHPDRKSRSHNVCASSIWSEREETSAEDPPDTTLLCPSRPPCLPRSASDSSFQQMGVVITELTWAWPWD